ncbi:MAG: Crp/Fnr family transcriptional regulator [Crocinitomicaceae bacterium]|nr:Crp/Fnr family transcriptional regulator [Flavobacteriales bacterium]NQZ35567.1 Crp/Fnr family transcriptional regulator [Crocinitomicaceae bacterium]
MKEQIRKYLNRYVEFSDTEIDTFYSKLIVSDYTKKEFLIQEGQLCTHRYFILKGLVRTFYIDNNGNEKITQFALENWWFTDMESFVNETPSTTSIQTLEKTTLLKISKTELELLFLEIPKLERMFRIITEKTLIAIQRKNDVYLRMKNKDIYELFLNQNPDFVQRVPQYMIASYLEMTPEYLSGIRK